MGLTVADYIGVKIDDILHPSAVQKYPLGLEVPVIDSEKRMLKKFIYVYAPVDLEQHCIYSECFTGTVGQEVIYKNDLGSPDIPLAGVPQVLIPAGHYGFLQTMGHTKGMIYNGTSFVAGEFLGIVAGMYQFARAGGVGVDSYFNSAVALEDSPGAVVAIDIMLLGRWFVLF